MNAVSLVKIGSQVNVDLALVSDRIPAELINLLIRNPQGKVVDYKMTDATGVGVVLELCDGTRFWFFDDEITFNDDQRIYINTDLINRKLKSTKIEEVGNAPKSGYKLINKNPYPETDLTLLSLFNPLNFLRWLLYSLKDIF